MRTSSYSTISKFGQNQAQCYGTNDPLTYCLQDNMDKNFHHSPNGSAYGPRSKQCQVYMAQRCANNWDGFCEYFYQSHGTSGSWPDNQKWPNTGTVNKQNIPEFLTTGEQLLQNTAERKYCSFENCNEKQEPFDPLVVNSPTITYYQSGPGCVQTCKVNPREIDNDPVMNRILMDPMVGGSTLINICNTSKNQGINLSGTKVGQFCDAYFANFNSLTQ